MGLADTGRIDALFAEWDRDDSPGMALGIVQDGELVYARGYGMANLDLGVPISPASVFHVASVSKQFTAISAALLAEEGKLALDEDVRCYVPELPDFGARIIPRHFILHTSGMRDQYSLFRLGGWRDDDVQAYDDVFEFALGHRRLNFPPGTEYSYCNTSYTLLSTIVGRAAGMPFRQFVRERIFEPLGMANSHVHDDVTEIVPGRASAYAPRDGGGFKAADSNVEVPGAICVYTTVEDLARWVGNFRRRTVAGAVLDAATTAGTLDDGRPLRYGYGLSIGSYRGLKTVSHGGVDSGYRAEMLWFPEVDFGVVILANLSTVKPGWLARKVADICLAGRLSADDLFDAPSVKLSDAETAEYAGLYRDERTRLTRVVRSEDGKLTVNGPFGDRMSLDPLGDGRFRLGEPPIEVRIAPGPDAALVYREYGADGRVLEFGAAEPADPNVEELAEYAGTFFNADLGTRYAFLVHDGKLRLRQRRAKEDAVEPTVADAFSLPHCDLVFSRDGRGEVNGLDVFAERIRYLRFERER